MNYSSSQYIRFLIRLLTLFILSCLYSFANADHKNPDSLRKVAMAEHPSEIKVRKQFDYANYLRRRSVNAAILYLDSAIEGHRNKDDYAFSRCLTLKAACTFHIGNFAKCIQIAHESLEVQLSKDKDIDNLGIGENYNILAMANSESGRYDDAKSYWNKATPYYLKTGDKSSVDLIYNNLGILENNQKNRRKALEYFHKSLKIRKEKKDNYFISMSYHAISEIHRKLGEKDSFHKYILLSVQTPQNDKHPDMPVLQKVSLAKYYEDVKKFSKAEKILTSAIKQGKKTNKINAELLARYELTQFFYRRKDFKQAYDGLAIYQGLEDSAKKASDAKQIAQIEEKYKNAENQIEIANLKAANLESQNAAQRFRFIAVSALLLLLILGAIFLFLNYRKRQKIKLNDSEVKTELERLKLIALRSKMNPHFLFNCINTAQNFILSAKKQDAYEYLEKFAKLLRKVLDSSPSLHISLEDEISQLRLYLELESIRANNGFKYDLSVDEELENGVYEIPGMILQPFVENAIIHGVSNLENKEGVIRIALKKDRNRLHVEIEDNGVGREVAMKIKRKKDTKFKSIAIPNIKERLAIMKENGFSDILIEVEDLIKENMPNGTKVKVNIELD